jgi:predicted MPP superfamily phosphohydrolase
MVSLVSYGIWVEPDQIMVQHVWIESPGLAQVLGDKVVVHISDLHIDKLGGREHKVLQTLDYLKPDLVFLTGDYVQWHGDYEPALEFLSRLKAEVGIWAVMGDYDYKRPRKSCLFCHEQGRGKPTRRHRVRFLRNSRERLTFEEGTLWIGGIDREPLAPNTEGLPLPRDGGRDPIILLSHNPLAFDLIGEDQDVLMLSGDTHGGQIFLPTWLWRFLGYEKTARYMQGLFESGRKKMFVSRGIGTSHFPIRLGSSPEVVVLHFTPHS